MKNSFNNPFEHLIEQNPELKKIAEGKPREPEPSTETTASMSNVDSNRARKENVDPRKIELASEEGKQINKALDALEHAFNRPVKLKWRDEFQKRQIENKHKASALRERDEYGKAWTAEVKSAEERDRHSTLTKDIENFDAALDQIQDPYSMEQLEGTIYALSKATDKLVWVNEDLKNERDDALEMLKQIGARRLVAQYITRLNALEQQLRIRTSLADAQNIGTKIGTLRGTIKTLLPKLDMNLEDIELLYDSPLKNNELRTQLLELSNEK